MDSCVRKTVTGKEINHRGQGLFVSLKLLKGGTRQVRKYIFVIAHMVKL